MSLPDQATASAARGEILAIGLDIGGTKIAGGVVTATGAIVTKVTPVPTPSDHQSTVRALIQVIDKLRHVEPSVAAVGVGAAGLVSWPDGFIRWAPNNGYRDLDLRHVLQETTGLPTAVDNDANVAAFAESRFIPGLSDALFVTVGTGIGGGLLLDGHIYRGRHGVSTELGHMIVQPGGRRCGCGNLGCLEAVASGTALANYGREAAADDPDGVLAQSAGGAANVTGETVYAAALAGDPIARRLYERIGGWLGVGLATMANLFDLQTIVIGGGVADAGDILLDPCRAAFSRSLFAAEYRQPPPIAPARLGNDAGWIGAAILAAEQASDTAVTQGTSLAGPAASGSIGPTPALESRRSSVQILPARH